MTENRRLRGIVILVVIGILWGLLGSGCQAEREGERDAPSLGDPTKTISALKIVTRESGMYQIGAEALKPQKIKPEIFTLDGLKLSSRGQEVPFWIMGQGEETRLVFYAEEGKSEYTRENIYWLVLDESAKEVFQSLNTADVFESPADAIEADPVNEARQIKPPPGITFSTAHYEENRQYLPQVEAGDHWLWSSLPAPRSLELTFVSDHVAVERFNESSATLRLALWASTEARTTPDHHLVIGINGTQIGEDLWDGRGRHTITLGFDAALLREGENILAINAPGVEGVAADINYIDWFEIEYPRSLVAEDGRLGFLSFGNEDVLRGFDGLVEVYDITDPTTVVLGEVQSIQGESVAFAGEAGHRYLVVDPHGYRSPEEITPLNLQPALRSPDLAGEYLVVGPQDLLEALEPLLNWRRAQGLTTSAIPVAAIYDQFNYGFPEPVAVQRFIQYAAEHWQPAPRFVLLLGDASYDPKGYISTPDVNRLPTFLVTTVFGGQTASDVEFVQLDDDPWPDLPVGRIPAQNKDQVKIVVDKIIAYEQKLSEGVIDYQVFAIADGQDPNFKHDAQSFLDLFPASYQKDLFAPEPEVEGANLEIRRYLEQGGQIVAYFGHGSVNMWGKDRLFSTEDVGSITTSGQLPVVVNMTCLTGLYTHPKVESLAEALLWQKDGGAVAVLAPSSLTLPSDQSFLSRALIQTLIGQPEKTLGEIHYLARQQVPAETSGGRDVLFTFMLFGDPALHLARP